MQIEKESLQNENSAATPGGILSQYNRLLPFGPFASIAAGNFADTVEKEVNDRLPCTKKLSSITLPRIANILTKKEAGNRLFIESVSYFFF